MTTATLKERVENAIEELEEEMGEHGGHFTPHAAGNMIPKLGHLSVFHPEVLKVIDNHMENHTAKFKCKCKEVYNKARNPPSEPSITIGRNTYAPRWNEEKGDWTYDVFLGYRDDNGAYHSWDERNDEP